MASGWGAKRKYTKAAHSWKGGRWGKSKKHRKSGGAVSRATAVRGCACASGGVKTHVRRKSPFGKSRKRVALCRSKATGVFSRKVRCHG